MHCTLGLRHDEDMPLIKVRIVLWWKRGSFLSLRMYGKWERDRRKRRDIEGWEELE